MTSQLIGSAVQRLSTINNFLLDLDGTLYLGNKLIDGAQDFIRQLNNSRKQFMLLTNNSSFSTSEYCRKVKKMGIEVDENQIFSSTHATIFYLKKQGFRKIYLLAVPQVEEEFINSGFELGYNGAEAVVVSFDKTISYEKIRLASQLLFQGVPYICTHPDTVCPTETYPLPDCGSFCEVFWKTTGRTPFVAGKPSANMIEAVLDRMGGKLEDMAMVGDRLYTDMKLASDHGLMGILVLSGETTRPELEGSAQKVDLVCESVGELSTLLNNCHNG